MIEIETFAYTPVLGWSSSRFDTFRSCRRRYYYHYYGKHDTEYSRQRINRLKSLSSVPLEVGGLVHDIIAAVLERLLVSNSEIDRDRFASFVEGRVRRACVDKEFFEVYYGEKDSISTADLLPAVTECLQSFLGSPRFDWIRTKALRDPEGWLIEPPGYGETRIDGMKAYCKVDFLFVVDGRVTILDWKTGRKDEEKHTRQLVGYSAWAGRHLGAEASCIEPVAAYLRPEYEELVLTPTTVMLAEFTAEIRAETERMYAYCRDVERNLPLEKSEFPMIDNLRFCSHCNFKELCDRR